MRNSVFNCPWKSFQLKSLHFLGMFLLMKFCENHSPQAMLTSGNFLLQYSFEATSVFLLRRNASYISSEVRRCSDFGSLLQMLKSISRILLILFPIFFFTTVPLFFPLFVEICMAISKYRSLLTRRSPYCCFFNYEKRLAPLISHSVVMIFVLHLSNGWGVGQEKYEK